MRALEDAESQRGSHWIYNPARWGTADGYVDYHSFVAATSALRRHRASQRLELAAAFWLGHGGEQASTLLQQTKREAEGDQ